MRKVLENKERAKQLQENGETVYPTEEILGSMKPVKDFAAFYANHKTDIALIKSSAIMEFADTMLFTKEELNAYRMGLDAFVKFFENSEADTKSYLMQAEEHNRKRVG